LDNEFTSEALNDIETSAYSEVQEHFKKAVQAEDPKPEDLFTHDFVPTPITEEVGQRSPEGNDRVLMVDCALYAVEELMKKA